MRKSKKAIRLDPDRFSTYEPGKFPTNHKLIMLQSRLHEFAWGREWLKRNPNYQKRRDQLIDLIDSTTGD